MSHVVDVILVFPTIMLNGYEGEYDPLPIREINKWLISEEVCRPPGLRRLDPYMNAGKNAQLDLYGASFDHPPETELVRRIAAASWEDPGHTQLIYKSEQDDKPRPATTIVELRWNVESNPGGEWSDWVCHWDHSDEG